MDEGRIVNTSDSGYRYEYYLTDHLGNNRVAFRTDSLGHVRLSMVQNYYPFGSDMGDSTMNYSLNPNNFYKYSNKELQPELDIDTYDFGARHYDAVIGRWMGIDPLSWLADGQSPYNYTENNPMNMIDPDGMQANPHGSWGGVPLGGGTSGGSWGSAGDWGGAGLNAGLGFYNAWNAFSFKDPTHLNMNFGGVQGNPIKPSISQGYWAGVKASNVMPFNDVTNTWNDWIEHPEDLLKDAGNALGSLESSLGSAFVTETYVNTYHNLKNYINASSYDKGRMDAGDIYKGIYGFSVAEPFSLFGNIGGYALRNGGRTFSEYKASQGGTATLARIQTETGMQRISTEFHHGIITQRMQKTLNLPNWAVNNKLNVWKLNTVQHSLIDPSRFQFLKAGFKPKLGWINNEYNWFTKFPK